MAESVNGNEWMIKGAARGLIYRVWEFKARK